MPTATNFIFTEPTNPLGPVAPWLANCDQFDTNPCSKKQADFFETVGIDMGFTDFRPATVNWAVPTAWHGMGNCERRSGIFPSINRAFQSCLHPVYVGNKDDRDGCIISIELGYAIVFGFGLLFTFLTLLVNYLDHKISGKQDTSESYNTGGRNVKIGLTGSVIVSQWTWAATLLQSSNVAWTEGISGTFWYAAGACVQVLLFGILAIEVKRKCPNAHTFLEFIDARWGTVAHLTFLCFALFTNFLVTGMLLLGGSAVMSACSGMDIVLCSILIPPFSFVLYTLVGGLKAKFMADYMNTVIIMITLCIFVTAVYVLEGDLLGGPSGGACTASEQCNAVGSSGAMYERLSFVVAIGTKQLNGNFTNFYVQSSHSPPPPPPMPPMVPLAPAVPMEIQNCTTATYYNKLGPVSGNKGGSYLTMLSTDGLIFGVINTVGNFGTVFLDQSYWQSAIAASPASAHKGYMLGGIVWFAIPFALATSLGLAGVAMNIDISPADAAAGLVPPAAATALIGKGGGILIIVMLFMAVTSTGSAECIAVASLLTYDVYRKYFNPEASGQRILFVSRIFVAVFGMLMGGIAALMNSIEIEVLEMQDDHCTWLPACGNPTETLSMGWVYVFMGNLIGSAVAPVALAILWKDCTAAAAICGAWGGLIGAFVSWVVVAQQLYCEANYYSLNQNEPLLTGNLVAIILSLFLCVAISKAQGGQNYDWDDMNKHIKLVENDKLDIPEWELTTEFLNEAFNWSVRVGGLLCVFLLIVWPIFISFPFGVLPKGTWAIWVSVAFTWGWVGTIVIIIMPIWENWDAIYNVLICKFASPSSVDEPNARCGADAPEDEPDVVAKHVNKSNDV